MQRLRSSFGSFGAAFRVLCVSVLMGSVVPSGLAQTDSKISELKFEGLRRVEADAVKLILSSKVGQPVSPSKVQGDIRAIYGMGYFHDVQVYRQATKEGGIRLIYRLSEKPAIRRVVIVQGRSASKPVESSG